MLTALIVFLCLAPLSQTASFIRFDADKELAKISTVCMTAKDYEELNGNIVKNNVARLLSISLFKVSLLTIGLTELRAALHFAPLGPWKPCRCSEVTESELASAATIEDYYNLVEPQYRTGSLDSKYLFEKNMPPAIKFLDDRFPSIRTIFRRRLEESKHRDSEEINRESIDRLIREMHRVENKIAKALEKMERNYECDQS